MMWIKSYFVKSLDHAIARARAELGEDALLLSSKKSTAEDGSGEGYEVAFGSEAAAPDSTPAPDPALQNKRQEVRSKPEAKKDTGDLESVRSQLDDIRRLLLSEQPPERLPELATVFANLVGAGLDPLLSTEILDRVQAQMTADAAPKPKNPFATAWKTRRFSWQNFEKLLRDELCARIPMDSSLGVEGSGAAVSLVGPGGAGKTTTLMKIAAFQVAAKRSVRVLTLDTELARRMQLQFFARKIGIAFAAIENPGNFPSVVEDARRTEIVLIDTPNGTDNAQREEMAGILAQCRDLDVHLVAPGYMAGNALRQCIARYRIFQPAKLILTKIDESPAFGTAISEAVQAKLSLSLVTDGISMTDLHAFSVEDLVLMALGRDHARAACA